MVMMNNVDDEKENIKCTVKLFKTRFYDSTSNFGIHVVKVMDIEYGVVHRNMHDDTVIIKGSTPYLQEGAVYNIVAKEVVDPKWGRQYDLIYISRVADLVNQDKQKIFLSYILTETQLNTLYQTLDNPFEAIKNEDIEKLSSVKGIGVKTAVKIIDKYKETVDLSEMYVELDKFGLTPKMIEKLVERYKSPQIALEKVTQNPYILADEVDGIGWTKADAIALNAGMDKYSPFRIKAFIKSFLNAVAQEGFSYVAPAVLMKGILDNLGQDIPRETIKDVLYDMPDLWWNEEKTMIALKKIYFTENQIAQNLLRLLNCENKFEYDGWEEEIKETEGKQGWEYTEQQKEGIKTVLEKQVVMITGYGGTGKSSIVKGMLDVFGYKYNFAQCALSGKAASRLSEVTGCEGFTIHRLLAYNPRIGGFDFNKNNPLRQEIIIVDEVSMIGGHLFYDLISSIQDGAKLIMLCDVGQLESIGTMNIAKDIIDSGIIPTVTLTQIHRQAQKSAIVTESLKIRESEQITQKGFEGVEIRGELQDLVLDASRDRTDTNARVVKHFKEQLHNVDSIMDLQVVVPMKARGDSSTFKLNQKLQDIYNESEFGKKEVEIKLSKDTSYILREGDKVINVRNNYRTFNEEGRNIPIYNGNMGIVKEIDFASKTLIVDFQFIGEIIVPLAHWKYIELGYAITCHKAQGSEFKITIVGLDYSSFTLLSKEWAYTGITRAKKLCILVAENEALRYAITTSKVSKKQTFLKEFLRGQMTIDKKTQDELVEKYENILLEDEKLEGLNGDSSDLDGLWD